MSLENVAYDSCSLGAWFPPECNGNSDAIITQMQVERGRLSGLIQQAIRTTDPMLALLESRKREFMEGGGDHLTIPILDHSRPSERDIQDWTKVRNAQPGSTPCKIDYQEIPYGSRTVSACLMQTGWKSPPFCKNDLVLKYMWNDQFGAILSVMQNWTREIWSQWARYAMGKSVRNVVLSGDLGNPDAIGEYPKCAPTTKITWSHLEHFYTQVRYATAEIGVANNVATGQEIILMGEHELKAFETNYAKSVEGLGMRGDVMLPELGLMAKSFGKYLIIPVSHPRRYRDRAVNETWEDALIPSFLNVEGQNGTRTLENPEYRDPSVAKYSETIWFNADAFTWLTPPSAMMNATQHFQAHNYSGDFELIDPPKGSRECDPKSKNIYFAADFMAGGFSAFPDRAIYFLHLACHECPCDIRDVCDNPVKPCDPEWYIHKCCPTLTAGELSFVIKGEIPPVCPPGTALYIVSEYGESLLIANVVGQAAFPGDGIIPPGTSIVVAVNAADNAKAVCRDQDPWKRIVCMTPEACIQLANTLCVDCDTIDPTPVVPTPQTVVGFATDTVPTFVDAGGADIVAGAADPADLQAQIQAYLDGAGGGGTVTITYSGPSEFIWGVTIVGNDGTVDGFGFKFVDAQANDVTIVLPATA